MKMIPLLNLALAALCRALLVLIMQCALDKEERLFMKAASFVIAKSGATGRLLLLGVKYVSEH